MVAILISSSCREDHFAWRRSGIQHLLQYAFLGHHKYGTGWMHAAMRFAAWTCSCELTVFDLGVPVFVCSIWFLKGDFSFCIAFSHSVLRSKSLQYGHSASVVVVNVMALCASFSIGMSSRVATICSVLKFLPIFLSTVLSGVKILVSHCVLILMEW